MRMSRISIIVKGDTIQTLFDTGAHAILSDEAKHILGNKYAVGTSFIVAGIFDKCRSDYPGWKFIKVGDSFADQPMIQVPKIKLGNCEV